MKKILSIALAVAIFTTSASSFSDVTDSKVNLAASSLASLGIVNGTGGNNFSPNKAVTRAEFSKIAVLALGDKNTQASSSFTIFPDVPNTHWAAGYINSAVRDYKMLKGYADGSFMPNKNITYAEGSSISLAMLGYKTEDIGALWPQSYISKAKELGIFDGIDNFDSNSAMSRGDTAVMIKNLLTINQKDGDILLKKGFKNVINDAILVETSETNSSIDGNSAVFYISGSKTNKNLISSLNRDLIGSKGYIVSDNNGKVMGFVPESTNSREFDVIRTESDRIETKTETIKPSNNTVVIRNGEKLDFSTSWFDILPDSKITIYYTENGSIDMIITGSNTNATVLAQNSSIPNGYKILKNGVAVDAAKEYDSLVLDEKNKIANLTDTKITGIYEKGSPSHTNPNKITVFGTDFNISNEISNQFKNLKIGQGITLIFDNSGNVCGAYSSDKIKANTIGVLQKIDGEIATIKLLAGPTIKARISQSMGYSNTGTGSYTRAYSLYRNLVEVKAHSDNTISISAANNISNKTGEWNIENRTLGQTPVTNNVLIFDKSQNVVEQVSLSDIKTKTVSSSKIKNVILDNAGSVRTIILDNVTGLANNYGIAYGNTENVSDGDVNNNFHTLNLTTSSDKSYTYKMMSLSGLQGGEIYAMPKYLEDIPYIQDITPDKLQNIGTVSITDFDGSESVKINNKVYPLVKDIVVYLTETKNYVTLREAKSNNKQFKLYKDESDSIRFITAK